MLVSNFLFTCGSNFLVKCLASGVTGMAAKVSLPNQLSATFDLSMLPNIDVSKSLIHTLFILNPVSTTGTYNEGQASDDYFIRVKSIKMEKLLHYIEHHIVFHR